MTEVMFYDHMTGELTELGKKYGFPKGGGEKHPLQFKEALARFKDANGKCEYVEGGKYEYTADEEMYETATSQCNVLRSALQNPQCSDDTRKAVVKIIRDILHSFQDTDEIKKRKEQIFLENPDFFPKESALLSAKIKLKPHLEEVKSEIKKRRSHKVKPEDRISGTVAADRLVEGIERGLIDKPKNVYQANKEALKIRKRLGLMLEDKGRH